MTRKSNISFDDFEQQVQDVLAAEGNPSPPEFLAPISVTPNTSNSKRIKIETLAAPFSYFGGKSKVAKIVWRHFGADIKNYIEPFCGSAAVLLARPAVRYRAHKHHERINDMDSMVSNFWRAVKYAPPERFAKACDQPYTEDDLIAWHYEIMKRRRKADGGMRDTSDGPSLSDRLRANVKYYDLETAARWVWGTRGWIAPGFSDPNASPASKKAPESEITSWAGGSAVAHLSGLHQRLKHVIVLNGDWEGAVKSETATTAKGITAVFLDPPYDTAGRTENVYVNDDGNVAKKVREWALANGTNPMMRIALCGYRREHDDDIPDEDAELKEERWYRFRWKAPGGYSHQKKTGKSQGHENSFEETIWFSPHCIPVKH